MHADPACAGNATGQQYRQATSFTYLGGTVTETLNLSDEIDRWIRAGWMGQALQAGTVRPPEGKPAASEGPDGEVRGSRGSLIRMRDMNPPEGLLHTKLRATHHRICFES